MKLRLAAVGALAGSVLACAPDAAPAPESREATAGYCANLPRAQYAGLERVEVADDWFEVYRVAPHVYAIHEPFQFQEVISYLILGQGGALMFDTGMGISRIRAVVEELTPLPVTVLNSHTHMDHVGGNAEFDRVLAVPGHTPDAIALLDREAGFLWTGDSFYEGPIWLFAPETDLEAYRRSMARLAGLVPDLTAVFAAHNTPVAQPGRLVQLSEAIDAVLDGTARGDDLGDGGIEYVFEGFSLLLRAESP